MRVAHVECKQQAHVDIDKIDINMQNYSFAKIIARSTFSKVERNRRAANRRIRAMQTLDQAQAPVLSSLLTWIMRALAATKPRHNAAAVAAIVAHGGHPSGV
jgi:hypothetical protein